MFYIFIIFTFGPSPKTQTGDLWFAARSFKPSIFISYSILSYAVKWNARQEHIVTQRNLLDAWRQVTEILLCCVPLDIFPSAAKQQLLLELLQVLENLCQRPRR